LNQELNKLGKVVGVFCGNIPLVGLVADVFFFARQKGKDSLVGVITGCLLVGWELFIDRHCPNPLTKCLHFSRKIKKHLTI